MKVDDKDQVIEHVSIPVIATGRVKLLCDKFVRAVLMNQGSILDETIPGERVVTRFFDKFSMPFNNGEYFEPPSGTTVVIYYDQDDYAAGKYPSITIIQ